MKKSLKKKIVGNFLTNLNFFIFFEFFSENVFKTLLRGRETTRKKYRIVFEKFLKYVIFFDFACPSITHYHHHHPSIHPSVNTSWRPAWNPGGWSNRLEYWWLSVFVCFLFFLFFLPCYFFFFLLSYYFFFFWFHFFSFFFFLFHALSY